MLTTLHTVGSSPLTRGKLWLAADCALCSRLIPAHAGKTDPARPRGRSRTAHPRSRGENQIKGHLRVVLAGSSPLTRGKRRSPRERSGGCGLIPAHAGKTPACGSRSRACRAHPRSRGENGHLPGGRVAAQGSSPLTRGKQVCGGRGDWQGRLIPAHAGKTRPAESRRSRSRAHPRSHGENRRWARPLRRRQGSSPLTRGKLWGRAE